MSMLSWAMTFLISTVGIFVEILAAPETFFLAAMPYEQHRSLWPHRCLCQRLGDRQNRNCSRAVIVRAVVDLVRRVRILADADMIVMRADRDHLIFERRVAAFPDGDDVLRAAVIGICRDIERRRL